MHTLKQIDQDCLTWLLDPGDPGVRYLALRDLLGAQIDDPEFLAAKVAAHQEGPISIILDDMYPAGYWVEPGPGYYPKYRGSVWAVITLGQLGASLDMDGRIAQACRYLVEQALTENGQFSINGRPSATIDCLQGNLCAALLELGFDDPRLDAAFEWMARSVTGEGVAPMNEKKAALRYYSGKCGPLFACGANNKMPCAWGAVKVMLAFSHLPVERRTPLIERAIAQGAEFLLDGDPARAGYPNGTAPRPSGNWWKFGFPVFYVTDLLQNVEALVRLGFAGDPRLADALTMIQDKQDEQGRWLLEYEYSGKTWVDFGEKKIPNKWVSLRAARALKLVSENVTL
jgi:hypothetical protein